MVKTLDKVSINGNALLQINKEQQKGNGVRTIVKQKFSQGKDNELGLPLGQVAANLNASRSPSVLQVEPPLVIVETSYDHTIPHRYRIDATDEESED